MPPVLQLIIMDAGQGDATLMVYPDRSLTLIDCGCKKNSKTVKPEIGKVLNHYLTSDGLKALVLTHPDGDHYNLVKQLIVDAGVKVGTVYYGGQASDYTGLTTWLDDSKTKTVVPFGEKHCSVELVPGLSYDGTDDMMPHVLVRVLSANAGDPTVKTDANPNSIVLLVTLNDINIFLMGDSTALTEKFIIEKLGADLDKLLAGQRNTLKVGHHGSLSSSTPEWLDKVKPQVAFISSDTKTFNEVSIPRSTVINRILALKTLYDFGAKFEHNYVQHNDATNRHQQVSTTLGLYTTLHLLDFTPPTQNVEFTAYGTSWHYQIDDQGTPGVVPACDWDNVNKGY